MGGFGAGDIFAEEAPAFIEIYIGAMGRGQSIYRRGGGRETLRGEDAKECGDFKCGVFLEKSTVRDEQSKIILVHLYILKTPGADYRSVRGNGKEYWRRGKGFTQIPRIATNWGRKIFNH